VPKFIPTISELENMEHNPWLTVRERKVFEMYFRNGVRIEDIAAELDVSRGTISRDLLNIKRKALVWERYKKNTE